MSKNDNNIKLRNGRAWPEVFAKTDVFGGIHVLLERNIPKGLLMRRQLIVTVEALAKPPRDMGVPPMKHGQDARATPARKGFCRIF
jgi:hypothetical protein